MGFFQIMMYWALAYVLYYGGMITYDLVFKTSASTLDSGIDEEDIDVSEEVKDFNINYVDNSKTSKVTTNYHNDIIGVKADEGGLPIDDFQEILNSVEDNADMEDDLAYLCKEVNDDSMDD